MPKNIIIMGAAGRDFHNFNVYFRDNAEYKVVSFTATQIPNIDGRTYPPELAGPRYPQGLPIYPEEELNRLIKEHRPAQVVFSYSDVSHQYVMHKASQALAAGADFWLLGPDSSQILCSMPVGSIGAGRTGCGKSQTTRRVADILQSWGQRVVVIRHPMPYGDLSRMIVQRFAAYADLDKHDVTIEEREEYEPHIDRGFVVYAGVDYEAILRQAEAEADVILWDGGNNDLPFYKSDLHIVVVDPLRPGHELAYHPGEANLRRADVVVINKIKTARPADVETVKATVSALAPRARVVDAASRIFVDGPAAITGKRVVVVEDGPTLTHGGMAFGAGYVIAERLGAAAIVDPRPYAVGSIAAAYEHYPNTGPILPAMGYGAEQIRDLEATLNAVPADVVVAGTPIDLRRILNVAQPLQRVRYELQEIGRPTLEDVLRDWQRKR